LRGDELEEIGKFLGIIQERIEIGRIVGGERELLGRIVLDGCGRDEGERVGALVEG